MLQWARANDCPWNGLTCLRAAELAADGGPFDVLVWAHKNGCPWEDRKEWIHENIDFIPGEVLKRIQ